MVKGNVWFWKVKELVKFGTERMVNGFWVAAPWVAALVAADSLLLAKCLLAGGPLTILVNSLMFRGWRVFAGFFAPTCPKATLPVRQNASTKADKSNLRMVTSFFTLVTGPKKPHQFTLTCANRKRHLARIAMNSLHRNRQRVMMHAYEAAQIRADLAGSVKPGGFGGGFLVFDGDVGTFSVVFQVAENADGEYVPGRALIADKDKVLRLLQSLGIGIFHFAFFVEVAKLAR